MVHTTPAEIPQQTPQPGLHPVDVHVVPEAGLEADTLYTWLAPIYFPGVEIENSGRMVLAIDLAQHPP